MEGEGCHIGTEGRMRTWFNFQFGRELRIHCLGVFSVCAYRSELIWQLSWRILLLSFTVPEDVRYDFPNRSLHLEFILFILLYSPDLAPSNFHLFLVPWSMISEDVLFRTTTSCNTACEKNSDVSQRVFRDRYRASQAKVEIFCWQWRGFCEKIIWTLWRLYAWYMCKFYYNYL